MNYQSAVVVVARDVTVLLELQAQLRHSETMAALGSIVIGVAHEVRNPLFAISSLVDAWSIRPDRDPRPFIHALRGAVGRVQSLMVELLEYGRPTTLDLQPHRVGPVLKEAIEACEHERLARGVHVVLNVASDAEVWMDPRRLVRVFINLVQNAVQHTPAEATVAIELRTTGAGDARSVDVIVRDEGPGFAGEDLPRVFTPFYSRRVGGFGLGLALSQRIVVEHRGKVSAGNHPEGGALVVVSLPTTPAFIVHQSEGGRPC